MSHRFGPAARLRSRADFTAVQTGGRRAAGRYLIVLGRPNTVGIDRLGIIASKRVGDAVERNRAKRRVRELFRQGASRVVAGAGFDLVVIVKHEMAAAPYPAVERDFQAALRKLRGARSA